MQEFNLNWQGDTLSLTMLLLNLSIGVVLSLILRWHFKRFGSTLSNREEFAQVFPFIALTTILIISVVKSSLALSLGLVGALSIVRFRTPIKEPEELILLLSTSLIFIGSLGWHVVSCRVK
jgi:ABC-type spermidine/putrescine transport system permease subunit II